MSSENIIKVRNLSYKYQEESSDKALNDVSFTIKKGEWIAIIGHNGSGKSTLAKTLNGLISPQEGSIEINNQVLTEKNVWKLRQKVGMVFQNPDNQFVGSTVEEDVAFGLENVGVPREEMLSRVHKSIAQVKMSDYMSKEPARLSGGQKQRVAIAGVVALRPDVIILDEATSMLDPSGRKEVMQAIRELKATSDLTVISITHDIDEAASADRVIVMKSGTLVEEGTPEEIFTYGEKLIAMGLDIPFPEKLKITLAEKGIQVPRHYMTEEGMVDWLWKSLLKK